MEQLGRLADVFFLPSIPGPFFLQPTIRHSIFDPLNSPTANPRKITNPQNVAQCNAATEAFALDTANRFISMGLKDLGYTYVNIDDCWSTMQRNSSGYLVADPKKWPRGIKPVVDEIHAKGLKFGLYGSAGTKTCAGYPASQGYEGKDAQLLAEWGVDYWKHDNCYTPCRQGLPQTCPENQVAGSTRTWYGTMRDAVLATKKPIFFSLCNWGRDRVWEWGKDYGNSWRMSIDIWNDWASVIRIGSAAAGIAQYSAPGGFNDLDMMVSLFFFSFFFKVSHL